MTRSSQITVIFYAALHAIDAALEKLGIPATDHTSRNLAVKTNASLTGVRDQYMNLYRISKVTRYDCDPDGWLPAEYLQVADLADKLLKPIEIHIETLLGRKLSLPPLKVQT